MSFKEFIKEAEESKDDIEQKIIEFFVENPYPEDSKVHNFAKELGIEPDDFETKIYKILSSFLSEGKSKSKNVDINSELLEKAIKIEMEHTTSREISLKIVKDHVAELGWEYYDALIKMEKTLEKSKKQ